VAGAAWRTTRRRMRRRAWRACLPCCCRVSAFVPTSAPLCPDLSTLAAGVSFRGSKTLCGAALNNADVAFIGGRTNVFGGGRATRRAFCLLAGAWWFFLNVYRDTDGDGRMGLGGAWFSRRGGSRTASKHACTCLARRRRGAWRGDA